MADRALSLTEPWYEHRMGHRSSVQGANHDRQIHWRGCPKKNDATAEVGRHSEQSRQMMLEGLEQLLES